MSNEIFEPYGTPKLKIYLKYGIFNGRFMWNCRLSPPHFHSPINQSTWRDLLSVLSKPTLQFIFNLGLTQARVQSPTEIIDKLREHCNAGRNRHIWRLQFASMKQRENQSVDKWLILYYVYKIDLYHCHFFTMHTFHLFFNIRKMINIQKLATEFLIWAVKKTLPWL